jgi:hypothetical protein
VWAEVAGLGLGLGTVRWLADDGNVHGDWTVSVIAGERTSLRIDGVSPFDVAGRFAQAAVEGALRVQLLDEARTWSTSTMVGHSAFVLSLPQPGEFAWQLLAPDGACYAGRFRGEGPTLLLELPESELHATIVDERGAPVACQLRLLRIDEVTGARTLAVPATDASATDAQGAVLLTRLAAGQYSVEAIVDDSTLELWQSHVVLLPARRADVLLTRRAAL